MNQRLVQVNNNYGAVSDEKGNISIISKESGDYDFESILKKENELEDLTFKLNNFKNKLSDNKRNMIFGEITTAFILCGELVLFFIFNPVISIETLIAVMSIFYLTTKSLNLGTYGTRIGRYMKKRKLTSTIEEIETNIPKLEKELQSMKEKTKYKINYSTLTETESKTSVVDAYQELSVYMEHNINEETAKVKVLSLRKK